MKHKPFDLTGSLIKRGMTEGGISGGGGEKWKMQNDSVTMEISFIHCRQKKSPSLSDGLFLFLGLNPFSP